MGAALPGSSPSWPPAGLRMASLRRPVSRFLKTNISLSSHRYMGEKMHTYARVCVCVHVCLSVCECGGRAHTHPIEGCPCHQPHWDTAGTHSRTLGRSLSVPRTGTKAGRTLARHWGPALGASVGGGRWGGPWRPVFGGECWGSCWGPARAAWGGHGQAGSVRKVLCVPMSYLTSHAFISSSVK